jgi:hypothetical protein
MSPSKVQLSKPWSSLNIKIPQAAMAIIRAATFSEHDNSEKALF